MANDTLRRLAMEASEALNSYISVHDQIFGFSLEKVVRVPGLFQPIDFESARSRLLGVNTRLEVIRDELATMAQTASSSVFLASTQWRSLTLFLRWQRSVSACLQWRPKLGHTPIRRTTTMFSVTRP